MHTKWTRFHKDFDKPLWRPLFSSPFPIRPHLERGDGNGRRRDSKHLLLLKHHQALQNCFPSLYNTLVISPFSISRAFNGRKKTNRWLFVKSLFSIISVASSGSSFLWQTKCLLHMLPMTFLLSLFL